MSARLLGSSHPHKGMCNCQAALVCVAITELLSNGSKKGLDKFRESKSVLAAKLDGLDTTRGLETLYVAGCWKPGEDAKQSLSLCISHS